MHAGAEIDQSLRPSDQDRQNVGCQHIDREDAGDSAFGLAASRLAIANARIVNYRGEITELVDLAGYGLDPGDGREIAGDNPLGSRCRRKGRAAASIVSPMHDDPIAPLDQEFGRHEPKAVR
jgi:hypothetical protein